MIARCYPQVLWPLRGAIGGRTVTSFSFQRSFFSRIALRGSHTIPSTIFRGPLNLERRKLLSNANEEANHSRYSYRTVLLASATAIATLTPTDEREHPANEAASVPDDQTREEALYQASRTELEDAARGLDKENASFLYIWYKNIVRWFYKLCYNPVATSLRFIQLALLFGPVLITFPIVLVGPKVALGMNRLYGIIEDDVSPSSKDRVGAIWWFKYLTWTMEMAGPSFIKVIFDDSFYTLNWFHHLFFAFCVNLVVFNCPIY